MELPKDFAVEIMPYLDETEPTPKEAVITRILEHGWEKKNFRSVLNYVFSVPAELFFKDGDHVMFT